MKIITLLNEKGGVGKTTLAVHIAQGLAARGHTVCLVDGSAQGNATVRCRYPESAGLYDWLVRDQAFDDVALPVPGERFGVVGERVPDGDLWLIPSNAETRNIANSISDAMRFKMRLLEVADRFDATIIDTAPEPSLLHGSFYMATDALLCPTKLTFTAFSGFVKGLHRLENANLARANVWGLPRVELLGIVPVDYRANTREQQRNLIELQTNFGEAVWPPVHQRTLWTESEGDAVPVWNLEPYHPASDEAWIFVKRVEEYIDVPISAT